MSSWRRRTTRPSGSRFSFLDGALGQRALPGGIQFSFLRQALLRHLSRSFHFALCASLWFIVPWQPLRAALKDSGWAILAACRLAALTPLRAVFYDPISQRPLKSYITPCLF